MAKKDMESVKTQKNKHFAINKSPLLKNRQLSKKDRIWEIDFIRGICVLLMLWDHFMFDIAGIFGDAWAVVSPEATNFLEFAENYFDGDLRNTFHPIIYCLFFLLCGISCNLSRNNLKRGVVALFFAFTVTIVTSLFEMAIIFGVLHMLAFSILIYYIISKVCLDNKRLISMVCLIAGVVIILIPQIYSENPPDNLNPNLTFIAEYFGEDGYSVFDYFPILPNLGYVLLGASVGGLVYSEKKSVLPFLDKFGWHKPITFIGSKALIFYILHQPIFITILSIISYLFITPGNFVFF